jgi:hypothetical protein
MSSSFHLQLRLRALWLVWQVLPTGNPFYLNFKNLFEYYITLVGLFFYFYLVFRRVSELIETLARYQKEGRPDTRPGSQLPTIVVEKLPLDSLDSDVLLGRLNFHLNSATRT